MTTAEQYEQLEFRFRIHPDMIYAKLVEKVGDRQYLRFWRMMLRGLWVGMLSG